MVAWDLAIASLVLLIRYKNVECANLCRKATGPTTFEDVECEGECLVAQYELVSFPCAVSGLERGWGGGCVLLLLWWWWWWEWWWGAALVQNKSTLFRDAPVPTLLFLFRLAL